MQRNNSAAEKYVYINQKLVIIQNSFFFLIEDGDPQGNKQDYFYPCLSLIRLTPLVAEKESGNMKEKQHILGGQVSGISV